MAGSERQVSLDGRSRARDGRGEAHRRRHRAHAARGRRERRDPLTNRSATEAEQLAAELNRRRAKSAFTVGADMPRLSPQVERMAAQVARAHGRPARRARQQRVELLSHADRHHHARSSGTISSAATSRRRCSCPKLWCRRYARRARRHRQHRRRALAAVQRCATIPSTARPKPGSRC